jgi:hypothetical protein
MMARSQYVLMGDDLSDGKYPLGTQNSGEKH